MIILANSMAAPPSAISVHAMNVINVVYKSLLHISSSIVETFLCLVRQDIETLHFTSTL